uniref:Uncharacterized protein n=1 Tax=Lates calcarifer TaxID=8187 RepID=A0A4W6CF50_LATCA
SEAETPLCLDLGGGLSVTWVTTMLQDLSGFTTARRSSDDHHGVVVHGRHDLLFKVFDGQLVAADQDLNTQSSETQGNSRREEALNL